MTKEEFESAINEDIKFVERIKHFFKHDDATRVMEHVKSVLEASVDYYYPSLWKEKIREFQYQGFQRRKFKRCFTQKV